MSDRRRALEAAIDSSPDDRDAYAIYADELQRLGDPRGELIALALAEPSVIVEDRIRALIADHDFAPGGPLHDLRWRWGFVSRAELDPRGLTPDELHGVLDHPSLRFLAALWVRCREHGLQPAIDVLARRARSALRELWLGSPRDDGASYHAPSFDLGSLDALWVAVPNLESLTLTGQNVSVGTLELPRLSSLTVRSIALRRPLLEAIVDATWPALQTLDLSFGTTVPDLALLERLIARPFPALCVLRLSANALDDLIEPLARAPLLQRLTHLGLHAGLTDRGAELIDSHRDAFRHLERLDVSENQLSPAGIECLGGAAREIATGAQREPVDHDPDLYDY